MALQFHQGRLTVAAPTAPSGGLPSASTQEPTDPFVWAEGGKRMTPADIAIARELAKGQMAAGADYSPVGHWTQGLSRVAQALLGGFEARRANKAEEANAAYSQQVMGALTAGKPDLAAATRAATDPYASPQVQELGKFWMDRLAPKPSTAQPYRFEDNAGNQWELGPDGQPRRIFTDLAPKQMVANGNLITSTNPYVEGAQPAAVTAFPQPGAIIDDPRLGTAGGAGLAAPQTFHP